MGFRGALPLPIREGAPQRQHNLREVCNALRYVISGAIGRTTFRHAQPSTSRPSDGSPKAFLKR
jgi:hypothetical protein